MAPGRRTHKHFQLDAAKIKRAQKILHATTETQAIDRALDFAISEYEKNCVVRKANMEFIQSGVEIRDVYGVLEP